MWLGHALESSDGGCDDGAMAAARSPVVSDALADELEQAGLRWNPGPGDQFKIKAQALGEEVFILSHMVIEAKEFDTGTVLGFNGTTEWALDSVAKEDALWLPREDQLRELLGGTFVALESGAGGYRVRTTTRGAERTFEADRPADAYAQALLALVHRAVESA